MAPYRPAASALCFLVLAATSGCAHFHNAEVRAQERAAVQHPEPQVAEAAPQRLPPPAPLPLPAPPPPVPSGPAPAPEPAPPVAVQPNPIPPARVREPSVAVAPPQADIPAPEVPPAPAPSPTSPPVTSPATPASGTADAVIIFANIPAAHCTTCETLKISIAPSGQVLMERGSWMSGHSNWRYKRSRAQVGSDRAAAFAASLGADRPMGARAVGGGKCSVPAKGDEGLSIEWIEADRDDRLTIEPGCAAGSQLAEKLRHAPDLLGLRQLALP